MGNIDLKLKRQIEALVPRPLKLSSRYLTETKHVVSVCNASRATSSSRGGADVINPRLLRNVNSTTSTMSATRIPVRTERAPLPPPFLSQGLIVGDVVYCSGQVGTDSAGKMVEGSIQDRTVSQHDLLQHVEFL